MTVIDAEAAPSAWPWWEGRRLVYNLVLFVTGWVGFALLVVIASGWDLRALGTIWQDSLGNLMVVVGRMGALYLVYMAAANVLFLLGAFLETVLKPEPRAAYRRRAWFMGLLVSISVPLIMAVGLGLTLWDPGHGG